MTLTGRPLRGRLVATAAVLVLAFACMGSGLDRIAVGSFGVAAAVPGPLRAQSLRPLAQIARLARQPDAALRLAACGGRRRPGRSCQRRAAGRRADAGQ